MKHFAVSALWITVAVSSLAAAEPKQFRYQASLGGDVTDDNPAVVTLSAGVISHTHNDFTDLRVFDDANREVPYVIYGKTLPGQNRQQAGLEPIKYEALTNGGERITYQRPAALSGIDGMQVTINGNDFEKNIQIETSEDNSTWKPLATCSVFDYSSRINLRNTKLDIPPTTARYLRLIISGDKPATGNTSNANDENVVLKYKDLEFRSSLPTNPTTTAKPPRLVTGVNAWYGKTIKERQVTDSAPLAISGSSTSEKGDTILDLGESNLPLTAITLDIGTKYFMRQVRVESSTGKKDAPWYEIANDSIYRFPAANRETSGRPNADTTIQLDGRQYTRLRLIIVNRDNIPLTVNSISGTYLQRNLYLLPEKSRHYAIFCDSNNVTFPRYDLPSVLPENSPELAKAVVWNLSEPQPNSAFDNKNEKIVVSDNNGITPTQLWLFRGLILLLAVGLAFWAWSTLRKLK